MLLGEDVVPAAVPGCEPVGVSLPGSRKSSTGQRLYINVTIGVCICSEVCLRVNSRTGCSQDCRNHQCFPHSLTPEKFSRSWLRLRRCDRDKQLALCTFSTFIRLREIKSRDVLAPSSMPQQVQTAVRDCARDRTIPSRWAPALRCRDL